MFYTCVTPTHPTHPTTHPHPMLIVMLTFRLVGSDPVPSCPTVANLSMAARSSSSCGLDGPQAKRLEVLQALQAVGKQTKTSTIKMLTALQQKGVLDSHFVERQLRSDMQAAVESVGNTMTPYGPIIQKVQLDAPGLTHWEVCHPSPFSGT